MASRLDCKPYFPDSHSGRYSGSYTRVAALVAELAANHVFIQANAPSEHKVDMLGDLAVKQISDCCRWHRIIERVLRG